MDKKSRQDAIDELTLALLYLTRFSDGEGNRYDEIAWKNYDFDAIDRLDEENLIINPKRKRGGGYKYAYMTEKGREKARELLHRMNIEDDSIYEKYEFRSIRPEEADEAAEIERICFPPNEACTKEHMLERINLTRNSFYMMAYENFSTTSCPSTGIFDELIMHGTSTMHPDDQKAFADTFDRQNLLAAYERGENAISLVTKQMGDDGKYHTVETTDYFVKHPSVDDVLTITLCETRD